MRRRTFIAGLGSAAAWSLAARAQQARTPVRIGVMMPEAESAAESVARKATFEQALAQLGQHHRRDVPEDKRDHCEPYRPPGRGNHHGILPRGRPPVEWCQRPKGSTEINHRHLRRNMLGRAKVIVRLAGDWGFNCLLAGGPGRGAPAGWGRPH